MAKSEDSISICSEAFSFLQEIKAIEHTRARLKNFTVFIMCVLGLIKNLSNSLTYVLSLISNRILIEP